ncbi:MULTISPECIES: hypothetical protein [unclassified Ensifer]|uniref:head-tail joining protein n=1 Tax=unclassified Ensifer TaxID=2633371 RepID=UPI000813C6D7|nr:MULTISPECIES: hypothetical protein [unclassified Ensifer]OCP07984.1 hypothetical protein BC362_10260 [Ensifer sp. LC14]OCP10906.1 hypothetical protein BC374_17705 [Ensifer sp. LC13]OCP11548.1 hypothetical protein BBX50_18150 [Ensifer sp. LC11]OCP33367.1 hypothetical protein BC364_17040 [Ensifer sp. LC499]
MHLNSGSFPIATAPGFETMADDLLTYGGSEPVVWTAGGQQPVTIRAIVRQFSAKVETALQTVSKVGISSILVAAMDVPGLQPGDLFSLRGATFRVADGGVWPDGFAMVKVEVTEVYP